MLKPNRIAPSAVDRGLRPGVDVARNLPSTSVSAWLNYVAFSPVQLAPSLWLDAANTASITSSGGLVSQWNDLSGNANHATASGTDRPTTNATTRNGRNVLDFNGSNVLGLTSTITLGAAWTVAAVAVKAGVSNKSVLIVGNIGVDYATYLTLPLSATSGTPYMGTYNSTGPSFYTTNGPSSYTVTNWVSLIGVVAGTGATDTTLYQNGTAGTAGQGGMVGQTLKWVGYYSPTTYSLQGSIGELIVVPRALSAGERTTLQTYLRAKWNTP